MSEQEQVSNATIPDAEAATVMPSHEEALLLLEDARSKADEHWNALLRVQAEMDNLRKRTERDIENAHKYALEKFVDALIPVMDSLDMGLEATRQENADLEAILRGTEMTQRQFIQAMEKFGVQAIDPLGEKFNPDLHQAMAMQPAEGEPNRVLAVMQKGYTLNGRLVRPALVVVSKAA
ncbi:MAG: nucleotide exchange factor GrpE [Halothiobacillaceae bacterium]|jgi:molecular chaperone GrpE|nr:nucleotide exchange factor GrpE [Halothiobacillaceae bacterium]MDY0049381.1 nucleotide exchange factor GrpE [Halothiobacillaceae bacterium]